MFLSEISPTASSAATVSPAGPRSMDSKWPVDSKWAVTLAALLLIGLSSGASASGFQVEFTPESKLSSAAKTTLIHTLQTHCALLTQGHWRFQEIKSDAVRFKIDQGVYDIVYHSTILASDLNSKQSTLIEMQSMYYEINNAPEQDILDVLDFSDSAKMCRQG